MSQELSAFAKKRKVKKIWRILFITVLLLMLLGVAGYFLLENFFVSKEVSVMKSVIYDAAEISKTANIKKGTPFYKLDRKAIAEKLEETYPYLEEVELRVKLPDKIQIRFREEYGKFALPLGVELFAVDEELNVLAKEKPDTAIERITLYSGDVKRCVVGETLTFIDEDTGPILLELAEELEKQELLAGVKSVNVKNQFDIRLDYQGRFEITMGDHTDIPLKLAMVKEVMKDLGSGASGRIDITDPDQAYVKLNDPAA